MTLPLRSRLLALSLFWVGVAGAPAWAGDAAAPDQAMRMYRDPETGAVGRPSAAALRAAAGAAPAAAPAEPLVEEPVRGPAGGMKINLRRSHRPAVVRYADPGGPVVHECLEGIAAAHE